jgi:hypothetical protein
MAMLVEQQQQQQQKQQKKRKIYRVRNEKEENR